MNRLRWVTFARRLVCAILCYSGLNFAFRVLFRRNDCVVLMYHRVTDANSLSAPDGRFVHPGIYVTKQTFEMQMEYVARHFNVIDVAHLVRAVKNGGRLPRYACVLTFDDGWKDNHTHAFPILKKHSLPATIFLVADYVGTERWFWQEKLALLLSKCLGSPRVMANVAAACPTVERDGLAAVLANRRLTSSKRVQACLEAAEALPPTRRSIIVDELQALLAGNQVPIEPAERLVLNWDEVREMSISKIDFGSHTREHPILTEVPLAEAVQEIAESKLVIESHLSTICSAFCYPNGQFTDRIKQIVMGHYNCAFSTERGFVKPGDDVFALKRIAIHNDGSFTRAMFACKISGFFDLILNVWKR